MREERVFETFPDDEYDDDFPPPRVSFSLDEGLHLALSVLVLAVAFSFALNQQGFIWSNVEWSDILAVLPYSVGIVITAFVLHELAHKVVAQRKHMWAEYRSSFGGLTLGMILSAGTGLVAAAPGYVYILGDADDRDSGFISIVGPLVNLVLGYAAALLIVFGPAAWNVAFSTNAPRLFEVVLFVNLILAIFNMLPVPPLDGSKVWRWSKLAYVSVLLLIASLGYVMYIVSPSMLIG